MWHMPHYVKAQQNPKNVYNIHTRARAFKGTLSGTARVSRYQKGKTNLDCTEAKDSEWQWHQLGGIQVCTLLQTDNHTSTPPLRFLQAGCPTCRPTNSVKALKTTTQRIADFVVRGSPSYVATGNMHKTG